jgi:hypothetical protein
VRHSKIGRRWQRWVQQETLGPEGGGDPQHIQNRALTDHLLAARRDASSLSLWSRMAQLTLSTKYITVEAFNPSASARGNIEITDSGLDVR